MEGEGGQVWSRAGHFLIQVSPLLCKLEEGSYFVDRMAETQRRRGSSPGLHGAVVAQPRFEHAWVYNSDPPDTLM